LLRKAVQLLMRKVIQYADWFCVSKGRKPIWSVGINEDHAASA